MTFCQAWRRNRSVLLTLRSSRGTLQSVSTRLGPKNFTVTVDGHRTASTAWRIDALLRFRSGVTPPPGDRAYELGRVAMFEGIVREGIRCRAHGATAIHIRMDIAGVVREFDFGTTA